MKKFFVIALGCGLAFSAVACGDSDDDLAKDLCNHMVECEMPGYTADTCKALDKAADNGEKVETKCEKENKAVAKCMIKASCDDLSSGNACKDESQKASECMAK